MNNISVVPLPEWLCLLIYCVKKSIDLLNIAYVILFGLEHICGGACISSNFDVVISSNFMNCHLFEWIFNVLLCHYYEYMIYVLFVVNIEVNNVLLRYEIHPIQLLKVLILNFLIFSAENAVFPQLLYKLLHNTTQPPLHSEMPFSPSIFYYPLKKIPLFPQFL